MVFSIENVSAADVSVIVNKKNASPEDILNLIKFIEKKALDEKGYKLERELRVLGFDN